MSVASQYPALSGPLPLTFAHRGGAGLWPENTLEAFRGAIELGCTHVETDVRMTRDGEIVVFHDETLERTTNGSGRVSAHTLSQLQRLDAGYRFSPDGKSFPRRGQGLWIPTLAEVVALSDEVRFNVEIKERGPFDLPRALLRFIEQQGIAERIVVAAERHDLMREFRRHAQRRIATSASRRECLQFWFASRLRLTAFLRLPYQALQIPVRAGKLTVVTPQLLDAAHREGLAVHVWTIDERGEMLRLLDLGVDGLMSDHPDRLRQVVVESVKAAAVDAAALDAAQGAASAPSKAMGHSTPVNPPG